MRYLIAAVVLCAVSACGFPAYADVASGKEFYHRQHGTLTIVKNGRRYTGHAVITVTKRAKRVKAVKVRRGPSARALRSLPAAARNAAMTGDRRPVHQWGAAESSPIVAEARRYIGTNPTGWARLWCARFMNMVLERVGLPGTDSNLARSFASYGRRVSGPVPGAIAVMSRGKRGGHVGVVSGIDANGNPIIISGNHNRRVAESVYPRGRVYAYVMP